MSVEISVKCNGCGIELDTEVISNTIYLDPCPKCLKEAKENGFEEGGQDTQNEMEE